MLKRNQIMITALAIMIAVAGYLNFAGTKAGQEQLASADAQNAEEEDMTALLDLSEEDIVSDLDSANVSDIESLDSDQEAAAVERSSSRRERAYLTAALRAKLFLPVPPESAPSPVPSSRRSRPGQETRKPCWTSSIMKTSAKSRNRTPSTA